MTCEDVARRARRGCSRPAGCATTATRPARSARGLSTARCSRSTTASTTLASSRWPQAYRRRSRRAGPQRRAQLLRQPRRPVHRRRTTCCRASSAEAMRRLGAAARSTRTVGLLGLIDVAERHGPARSTTRISARRSAAGASATGPYLVLPILGPRTVRDAVGLGRRLATPIRSGDVRSDRAAQYGWSALRYIERARRPAATRAASLEEAALDKYVFHARRLPAAPPQPDLRRQARRARRPRTTSNAKREPLHDER